MSFGVIVLGNGGGVVTAPTGNTNFAIVPGLDASAVSDAHLTPDPIGDILSNFPYWLLDCGPETAIRLCGGTLPHARPLLKNLMGILITHTHTDHTGGLAMIAWRGHFIEKIRPKLVYAVDCEDMLMQQLVELHGWASPGLIHALRRAPTLHDFFDLQCACPATLTGLGTMMATPREVNHNIFGTINGEFRGFPGVSWGVHVDDSDTRVLFSGDTAVPLPRDLVAAHTATFHDVQFYDDGSPSAVHCPYEELAASMPDHVQRSTVWLSHYTAPSWAVSEDGGFRWAQQDTIITVANGKVTHERRPA